MTPKGKSTHAPAHGPEWWLLKITPNEPERTGAYLDHLFPGGPGTAGKLGLGTWGDDGPRVDRPWNEIPETARSRLDPGAITPHRYLCDRMAVGDRIVVASGTEEIHAMAEVTSGWDVNEGVWRDDWEWDWDWFCHFRPVDLLARFCPPLQSPRRMSRSTLVRCKADLRHFVLSHWGAPIQPAEIGAQAANDLTNDPVARRSVTRQEYARNGRLAQQRKAEAEGRCELCGRVGFLTDGGLPYCEVHHIIPLGEDGWDGKDNIAVLCPACHAEIHHGVDRDRLVHELLDASGRQPIRKLLEALESGG